jgi:hypothetical protein
MPLLLNINSNVYVAIPSTGLGIMYCVGNSGLINVTFIKTIQGLLVACMAGAVSRRRIAA